MIAFPCHCGLRFEVDDDQAGGLIQCPRCSRLNDIPTLDDLSHLEADGTLKFEEDRPLDPSQRIESQTEAERLAELQKIFTRQMRVEEPGREIDLRQTFDDVRRAGVESDEIALARSGRQAQPRYDPITGELIQPMEIRPDPVLDARRALPVPTTTLTYAQRDTNSLPSIGRSFVSMFGFVNIFVMLFVMLIYIVPSFTVWMVPTSWPLASLFLLAAHFFVIAHYGCVIEEMGAEGRDELPRPLRDGGFIEDMWLPFCKVAIAACIAFAPMMVLAFTTSSMPVVSARVLLLASLAFGLFVLPATLITTTSSGTILNLRPDRIFGVIYACGFAYLVPVVVGIAALAVYAVGVVGVLGTPLILQNLYTGPMSTQLGLVVSFLVLFVATFLLHWYCWVLGLLYRAHQPSFPWVLQQHVPVNKGRFRDADPQPAIPAASPNRPTKSQFSAT